MRQRTSRVLGALVLAAVVGLTGCTGGLPDDLREPAPEESLPAPAEGMERFHSQELDWSDCKGGECATLTVPVDHEQPEGETMELALLRVPAKDRDHRIGSLVVNPGGPGSSGIAYAQAADAIVGKDVRRVYDVVGFDPRGVARSEPVDCVDDRTLDTFLGLDTTPDDQAEQQAVDRTTQDFVAGCERELGDRLGHITTEASAADMDVLRAALGDSRLNFLGLSYGTQLGATYAERFPERVGAFVLDGVLPTNLDSLDIGLGQARGFERATNAYLQWCVDEGDCPLGDSTEAAGEGLRELMSRIDQDPPPVQGDPHVDRLTVGWATYGLAAAMYSEDSWPALTQALRMADEGQGRGLMALANSYADRTSGGEYASNLMEAFNTYTCNDRVGDSQGRSEEEIVAAFEEEAPLWGEFLLGEVSLCEEWPVEPAEPFEAVAKGSEPILVIGTTRDPATPLEWAEAAAESLENGHLLTLDGDGHTAYRRGNECIDTAVDDYLLTGAVPEGDAARCD
ncbi:alpha/beta fold hydrolase [Kytococcus sedentarius]|uniref:alpha/beta hydrolase n=1 Tax=Kytococcus sedentarius TaxID=1276 RepID=UPI0035BC688D